MGALCRIQVFDQDSCDDFDVIFWDWAVMSGAVDWILPDFTADVWYTSPDLKQIVQAYVDRPSYTNGSYLGLKFVWQLGLQPSHEVWAFDGNASSAAKLEITYTVESPVSNLLVFAEAPTFARLDIRDPCGWFYHAVLYNPTDADIVVTGLRWWYKSDQAMIRDLRDAICYDTRYLPGLPTTLGDPDTAPSWTLWRYPAGNISINVPAKGIVVTWIEVPTRSNNGYHNRPATYYVEAYDGSQWISSPIYDSHGGDDAAVNTIFRADFDLATSPDDENQTHPNPQWLFNEDRTIVAETTRRVRLIPIASGKEGNAEGIDRATINITLPSLWSYVPGSSYNPYSEDITYYSIDGKDRLKWDLNSDVSVHYSNQSMAQNYIEFNVTAPSTPGIYNFTINSLITALGGRTIEENQFIYVNVKSPPKAYFTYSPTTPLIGEIVTFNASESKPDGGTIVSYAWDFENDSVIDAYGMVVNHTYATPGAYIVTLNITDSEGLSDTEYKSIKVGRVPVAVFTYSPEAPILNQSVTFNASSSYDPDGTIANYLWDFGDGANGAGVTISHSYASVGTYNVTLTVTDNDGHNSSTSHTLTVYIHDLAILSVTPSTNEVYVGQTVNISVVVRNEGTANETFNVTLYYDGTAIGTQTVIDLEPGTEATLRFSWDTTDVTPDVSYKIKAEATGVTGETDTVDNTYTYDTVRVKSQVTSPPPDWSPILPYLIPILLGGLAFLVVGISRKKREVGQGFEFFNEMTDGGIPDAYSVMIIGGAGSGKSVLCQQLAYNYITQGKSDVYVTYDIFPFEVRKNMKNFGWDISTYEQEGTFKFVDSYSDIAGLDSEEKYYVEQPFSLSDLGITMSSAINDVKHKSIRVFLDSTAPLFARVDPSKVTEFLQDRSARIKGDNGAFFFTVGEGTVPSDLMHRLEEIVDCIIELDVYEGKGKTWKRMRIRKLRGRRVADAWIPFKIELKKGITFLPPKGWIKSRKS